jgi:hypothetical protein
VTQPRHRIRRQTFEIAIPQREAAWSIQSELSRIQSQRLEAILDRCLSDFVGPNQIYRIDTLEIDLGRINLKNLEHDLVEKLGPALQEALQRQRREDLEISVQTGDDPLTPSQLELLTFFMQTGALPWWADTASTRIIDRAVGFLLQRRSRPLLWLVRSLLPERVKLLRLVQHCDEERLHALFVALASSARIESTPTVMKLGAALPALLRAQPMHLVASFSRWRSAIFCALLRLTHIDTSGGGSPRLWQAALGHIALEIETTYAALLDWLHKTCPDSRELAWPDETIETIRLLHERQQTTAPLEEAGPASAPSKKEATSRVTVLAAARALLEKLLEPGDLEQTENRVVGPASVPTSSEILQTMADGDARPTTLLELPQHTEGPLLKAPVRPERSAAKLKAPVRPERSAAESKDEAMETAPFDEAQGERSSESRSSENRIGETRSSENRIGENQQFSKSPSADVVVRAADSIAPAANASDILAQLFSRLRKEAVAAADPPATHDENLDGIEDRRAIRDVLDQLQRLGTPLSRLFKELHAQVARAAPHRLAALLRSLKILYQRFTSENVATLAWDLEAGVLHTLREIAAQGFLPPALLRPCIEALRQEEITAAQDEDPQVLKQRARRKAMLEQSLAALAKQTPIDLKHSDVKEAYVENAGLVILWPFLANLFERLELWIDKRFVNPAALHRAVGLMQHLVSGTLEPQEYELTLPKLLCGMEQREVLRFGDPVTEAEAEECATLLSAAILHAKSLGDMPIEELRQSFLLRKGVLSFGPGAWLLRVERADQDVLLQRLPWSVSWLKLPWLETPIQVEW